MGYYPCHELPRCVLCECVCVCVCVQAILVRPGNPSIQCCTRKASATLRKAGSGVVHKATYVEPVLVLGDTTYSYLLAIGDLKKLLAVLQFSYDEMEVAHFV